ncbi:hypothetical protein F4561_003114 [Lipingzhangella halophila]|uniref:Uncharacterized protein n=1 Tax=Lipingzhangella halophila TaxID=1783352 RepID=A0A7W7W3Y4_9ACTN|nr:hypothetical protein [Lipingzhangella halophila]
MMATCGPTPDKGAELRVSATVSPDEECQPGDHDGRATEGEADLVALHPGGEEREAADPGANRDGATEATGAAEQPGAHSHAEKAVVQNRRGPLPPGFP